MSYRSSVLIVSAERTSFDELMLLLLKRGLHVAFAPTARDAELAAMRQTFDFVVLDPELPDAGAPETIRRVQTSTRNVPFVVVCPASAISLAVTATKLGAMDVRAKPVPASALLELAVSACTAVRPNEPALCRSILVGQSRSSADRWAGHVVRATSSPSDLKTLQTWAHYIGVSYSSLAEACRLVDIRPQRARDIARAIRALIQSRRDACAPSALLDVGDRRTLNRFLVDAGPAFVRGEDVDVDAFLATQQFVAAENEGLRALRSMVQPDNRAAG